MTDVTGVGPRSIQQRLIALAGVGAIVAVVVGVLYLAGVFDSAEGDAAELLETERPEGLPEDVDVGPQAGEIAPDFEVSDLDGARERLSDYRGQIVYLNFWASWCVPCRAELPEIESLQREVGEDLAVVTVNVGEDEDTARDFLANEVNRLDGGTGASFTVDGIDPTEEVYGRYQPLPIDALPISVFIDERGVVSRFVNGQVSGDEMREAVDEAMGVAVSD